MASPVCERLRRCQQRSCSDRPNTTAIDKHIEALKKMILDISSLTIGEVADDVGLTSSDGKEFFLDVLDKKRAASKVILKLSKFLTNPTSQGDCSEAVEHCQRR